jgi:hypothetical protein
MSAGRLGELCGGLGEKSFYLLEFICIFAVLFRSQLSAERADCVCNAVMLEEDGGRKTNDNDND